MAKPDARTEIGSQTDNMIPDPPDSASKITDHCNGGVFTLCRVGQRGFSVMSRARKAVPRVRVGMMQELIGFYVAQGALEQGRTLGLEKLLVPLRWELAEKAFAAREPAAA